MLDGKLKYFSQYLASMVKNKNVTKLQKQLDELTDENKNMQNQLNKLQIDNEHYKQTIEDLTIKINSKDILIFKLKKICNNYVKLIKQISLEPIRYINNLMSKLTI